MATVLDFSKQVDMAGMDEVVSNERARAMRVPITLTGTAALGTAYATTNQGVNWVVGFGPPRTVSTAANQIALAADILTGVITFKNTTAGSLNLTLDSAANIVAAVNSISSGAQVGDWLSCLVINSTGSTGGGIVTIVNGSGGSFDANQSAPTILVGASRMLYIRLTNVTIGSEAYQTFT